MSLTCVENDALAVCGVGYGTFAIATEGHLLDYDELFPVGEFRGVELAPADREADTEEPGRAIFSSPSERSVSCATEGKELEAETADRDLDTEELHRGIEAEPKTLSTEAT